MVGLNLSYVTLLAREVATLCQFYVDALGLEEVLSSRDERYREVRAGNCMLGFATQAVRPALNLPESDPEGHRSLITFDVGSAAAIPGAVERAIARGARMMREPLDMPFGQRQAVLADPEGNLFRLSAASGT